MLKDYSNWKHGQDSEKILKLQEKKKQEEYNLFRSSFGNELASGWKFSLDHGLSNPDFKRYFAELNEDITLKEIKEIKATRAMKSRFDIFSSKEEIDSQVDHYFNDPWEPLFS